jgi:NADPH:quinone reductase-like Zn-dependent oxidoreductase
VGAYAVQFASQAGLRIIATAAGRDLACVRKLGATQVLDYSQTRFENEVSVVDIVLDTVGGETRERSIRVLKPGGILVSVVAPFAEAPEPPGIRRIFFLVEVTIARLTAIAELFHQRRLSPRVGEVLPLEQVQTAHRMLAGAPHSPGKIVLRIGAR